MAATLRRLDHVQRNDAHADIDQLVASEARGMIHDDGLFLLIKCGNAIFSRNGPSFIRARRRRG
jgi:hypothetical protein